eukprot:Phypoly_transcript_02283.p1 GENE.Phypoly_transcript_02283~~Phypoly_transcript_02283.p1  ORF type:complete len:920 (+),score=171.63 Phypoly_transcript_02283:56-2815(+)
MRPQLYDLAQNAQLTLGVKHIFARPALPFAAENERVAASPASHVVGLFQDLVALRHANLCEYVELVKGKHDRMFLVSEHYANTLRKKLDKLNTSNGYMGMGEETIREYAFAILNAIVYLHENEIYHSNITPDNILFDDKGNIKLCDYGLQYITHDGSHVSFAFGNPKYMSPETIGGKVRGSRTVYTNPKSVVWALGLILWELVTGKHPLALAGDTNPSEIFARLYLLYCEHGSSRDEIAFQRIVAALPDMDELFENVVEKLGREQGDEGTDDGEGHGGAKSETGDDKKEIKQGEKEEKEKEKEGADGDLPELSKVSPLLRDLISRCLVWNPKFRLTAEEVLQHPFFRPLHEKALEDAREWAAKPILKSLRLPDPAKLKEISRKKESQNSQQKELLTLGEVFHFWKLLGGNVEAEISLQKAKPAIQKLPFLVPLHKFSEFYAANSYKVRSQFGTDDEDDAKVADQSTLYDDVIHTIALDALRTRLAQPTQTQHFSSLTSSKAKEQSFDYQRHRLQVFREILRKFHANVPQATHELSDQAKIDIPSILRGEIWSALLGIRGNDYISEYESIDVLRIGPSDKQILLDIPRCHQYHPLLASPTGHKKFKRILKAWVASNKVLVYWQGLDSTLAPFLALHFTNEALAFACLQKFMTKYLQNFYTKDNALALQEYLSCFRQIVAYHDPQLASHLNDIDFQPDLYAIPWFLTSFTHIFPLDRVYPLWDALLQGPSPLPLFIAAAIIIQLRTLLLTLDFNNAILLFSNLPSIDIGECIKEAQAMFEKTPMSASLSSYTKDGKHWWEKPIPPKMARKELAPRIAVHDIINMNWPFTILDIRPYEEFQKVRYPNSVWVNLRDKQKEITTPAALEQYKGTHIITVGAKDEAALFANQLIKFNFPQVSVLNGGMDALKATAEPLLSYSEPQ